ncbi:hypothetical protein [uncultured Marinobacter sp.]|uniref:hypothetical protein n=1 Tax=uncultured Marinobacter sp. TaxID=187379 RepID=UPI00259857FB|nr:hypothetical protein [uncultured Marinobacter sp.]
MYCITLYGHHQHINTDIKVTKSLPPNSTTIMVLFCFACGAYCSNEKGLENHLKSRPGCLDEFGLSPAATLGLSSAAASSEATNHHSFHFQTDAKLAAKRPVDFMWHDETTFDASSTTPESPSKFPKPSSASLFRRTTQNSSMFIEHRCGTKTIEMSVDENDASRLLQDLLIDELPVDSMPAHALRPSQIQNLESFLRNPASEDILSDDDESRVSDDGQHFWEAPSFADDHPTDNGNGVNVEEDERKYKNSKMYTDRGNGCFTNEEILSIRLLGIMRDIGAPLKTYERIVAAFKDVITDGESINTTYRCRDTALQHFSQRFCMKGLYPTVLTQPSPVNNRFYPVIVHNAQAMIESLLYSSLAKDDNNLLFPNLDDPLAPPPSEVPNIADIDTGDVYRNAYKNLCTRPNHVVCGIICYIDKLATDRHGHLSLEPVWFTLSIFNQKTRNRPEAWRPLGYIPNIGLMSKAESTHAIKSSAKVQLYHDILTQIFGSLVELQGNEGGLPYQFHYRGKVYNALLLFPLLAVLGDTEGHDRLCGRYNSRGTGVARLCRHCNTPRCETDNVDYDWEHILPEQVQRVINANDKEGLKALSQHPIRNAFYESICLGGNKRGIHGMSPGEPLHVLELGLFKMMTEGFYVNLGYKPGSKSYPKILQVLDVWARKIGKALGHQSDRKMPRTYFPNGVTGGTKLAGHEMNGVILVLLILCKMKEPRTMLLNAKNFQDHHLRGWIKLFESMLVWRWWLKLPSVPKNEIKASEYSTHKLLKLYRSVVKRKHGSKLLVIKFHLCLHFLENQLDFGVTSNVDTGPMESNHKSNSKKPSGQTQRRADTFELQTSRRYIDNLILDKAASTYEETHPPSTFEKLEPVLVGAKFTIELSADSSDELVPYATIVWDKSHRIERSHHPRFLAWLCSNILAELGPDVPIRGCTEHKRKTPTDEKYIFRAHPSWRGGSRWHDWAVFSWATTNGTPMRIPGHIITFIEFKEEEISKLQHLPHVFGDTPGLYAMIETLEQPLAVAKTYQRVVVGGRKQLTNSEMHERRMNGSPLFSPNLCLVPVDTIYEPIAAIPDEGGSPGDFLFVRSVENWGYGFSQLIEDNEEQELAELEGIGSSSSNSEKAEDLVSDDSQSEDSVDSDNVSTTYSSSS